MTAADILRETAADMRFLGAGSGPLSQAMDFAREISEEWGVRTRVSIDTHARTDCGTRLLWSIFEVAAPPDANRGAVMSERDECLSRARVTANGDASQGPGTSHSPDARTIPALLAGILDALIAIAERLPTHPAETEEP